MLQMNDDFFGQDLDLGLVADEEGNVFAGPHIRIDLQAIERRNIAPHSIDLNTVRAKANLIQSLILRLKTEQGELECLGHPFYGSKHHRLIGEPNTENNRNLIKLYIIECLKQEHRLEKILKIDVELMTGKENRDKVKISIIVKLQGIEDPLNLVVPFSFGEPLE
jgi:hypothetical protein